MEDRAICSANDALKAVIEDDDFQGVGGFPVRVSIERGKFIYLSEVGVYVNKMDLSKMFPNADGSYTMGFGNRADGDYGMEFIADNDRFIPTVYFYHGQFGMAFPCNQEGAMEADLSPPNLGPRDFETWCLRKHGVSVRSFHRGQD